MRRPFVVLVLVAALCSSVVRAGYPAGRSAMRGPSAPSLVTHEVAAFRHIVRCMVRWRGALWFGTYGDGLFRLGDDGGLTSFTVATSPLPDDRVNTLLPLGDELWVGSCQGIAVFDGAAGWRIVNAAGGGVAGDIYHCMRRGPDGAVWVGTTGQGLSRWDGSAWTTYTVADGLNSDWINDVAFRGDEVWVATSVGVSRRLSGASRWENATPRSYPINRNTVWLAAVPARDELWAASSEGGVHCFQDGVWYQPPPKATLPTPRVYCLEASPAGVLWVGTEKGVVRYDLDAGWHPYGPAEGLEDPYTKVLYWDEAGRVLWAGSYGGVLARFDGERWRSVVVRGEAVLSPAGGGEAGKPTEDCR